MKITGLLLILLFAFICQAGHIQPVNPQPRGVKAHSMGFNNTVYVAPGDNLQAKYDWLKSSDRDSEWGALSDTNWRVLVLTPGTYNLTSKWTWGANYIEVKGETGHWGDVIVETSSYITLIEQTADTVRASGFTVRNKYNGTGAHGFVINATDNSASIYQNLKFIHDDTIMGAGALSNGCYPICGYSDIKGLWWNCKSEGSGAWYPNENKTLGGEFWFCVAEEAQGDAIPGERCFGGDKSGATISGKFYYCEALGQGAFGGCTGVGVDVTEEAEFWFCEAGDNAYGLGKKFAGKAYYCSGWLDCFGGTSGSGVKGSVEHTAWIEGCTVTGGKSFGCGEDKKLRGTIINCYYPNGYYSCDTTAQAAAASLTTSFDDPNSNITFTARNKGVDGNNIRVKFSNQGGKGSFKVNVSDLNIIAHFFDVDSNTASEIVTIANENDEVLSLVKVELAPGSDGSGYVSKTNYINLSGGVDSGTFRGNCFPYPIVVTESNWYVWPILNGQAYTNEGADANVMFHLPAARMGLHYPFTVKAAQQLQIDPNGTNTIAISGIQQDAGKYIWADVVGEKCEAKCVKDDEWETEILGTWTVEP